MAQVAGLSTSEKNMASQPVAVDGRAAALYFPARHFPETRRRQGRCEPWATTPDRVVRPRRENRGCAMRAIRVSKLFGASSVFASGLLTVALAQDQLPPAETVPPPPV